ncbi:DNA-binding transcriptional regulator, MerR family [Paenibacillus uliginis N3/975]|uniref:DNA-binding transcriptional regulator, MerR family n=1 Tax=Paenibacillus uliginis N3/975 TaxID=1313296 RepID=A0A1X7GWS4_9BACL|nr:DNA-binding transcriptional regulator, MerR family [Paenibacillus uliginis N3/975]
MQSNSVTNLQKHDGTDSTTQHGTYSIGEASKMIGSNVKTVRYYDEIGLLKATSYTEGRHRLYTKEDIWRLQLITTLRYLDFGIDDISKMISGETPVDKALDWQIESLETQVSTLTNMISILRQAKEHEGNSLRYIHDLVNARTIRREKRKQFINETVVASNFLDGIPPEWRTSFLYFFNKYIVNQVKISAKHTVAWNELQELICDPLFIADIKNDAEFLFFNLIHRPQLDAAAWVKRLEGIHNRLNTALKQKLSADSPIVQAIVEDMAMLYENSEQSMGKKDFFRIFAKHSLNPTTERIERFITLCSILSPQFHMLSKGNHLLLQGIQWKLEHM